MTHRADERNASMGRRLAALRALRGWTQTEAATKAGITQAYLSELENDGTTRPALATIEKLAKVYGASLDYVARGTSYTEVA